MEGYEIHMGISTLTEDAKALTTLGEDNKLDGCYSENVYGSYLHGIFDKDQVVKEIVMALGKKKGLDLSKVSTFDMNAFKETQYDILAAELRKHLNMDQIYKILGI